MCRRYRAVIGEYTLSPDQSQVSFTSSVPVTVKTPKDCDENLDKAQAYVTEDLMQPLSGSSFSTNSSTVGTPSSPMR